MQLSLYCFLFSNVSSGFYPILFIYVFPGGSDSKVSAYNAGDLSSIPGSGKSPGEGNGSYHVAELIHYCEAFGVISDLL